MVKNNVRKTGGKPSNRREEIREQKARGKKKEKKGREACKEINKQIYSYT